MFGLDTLNVVVGLVTLYLAFGVACTATVEAVTAWLDVRSRNLEAAMHEFLDGQLTATTSFVQAFFDHPLIQSLSKGRDGRPPYIHPEIVSQTVEALVMAGGVATSLTGAIDSLPGTPQSNPIKGLLRTLATQAGDDAATFRKAVETHFDAVMDRANGWFKRYAHNLGLVVATVLVIGANVDTVVLATALASSSGARIRMMEIAEGQLNAAQTSEKAAADQTRAGNTGAIDEARKQTAAARAAFDDAASSMKSAGLPLGWKEYPGTARGWVAKAAGLLVSVLAVSLGAPFWFDVLQRFMRVRTSGISPREKD